MKKFTKIYEEIQTNKIKSDLIEELSTQIFDEYLPELYISNEELGKLLPKPWIIYKGSYSSRDKTYLVINVKYKGMPDFQSILKKHFNIQKEKIGIEANDILYRTWLKVVEDEFENLSNDEVYEYFTKKDFAIVGRSGGYWGVKINKNNEITTLSKQTIENIINKFLNSPEGKNLIQEIQSNNLDQYEYNSLLTEKANDIIDLYKNEIKNNLILKPEIQNDLTLINKYIQETAKTLESEEFWTEYFNDNPEIIEEIQEQKT